MCDTWTLWKNFLTESDIGSKEERVILPWFFWIGRRDEYADIKD
jgi:hypothetical protein